MGCGQSSRVESPDMSRYYADQQLMDQQYVQTPPSAMAYTSGPPHLNFDPRYGPPEVTPPNHYEPPNSAARFFAKNQVVLDEEMLEEYIRLERMIQTMERGRILQRLQGKVDELRTMTEELHELEKRRENLLQHVESHQSDAESESKKKVVDWASQTYVFNRKELVERQLKPSPRPSPDEDLQYASSLMTKEIEKKKKKLQSLTREVDDLNLQAAQLLDLYLRLDEHLAELFSSGSGNAKIRQLEDKLEQSESTKQRLEVANAKWQESQMLLEFACRQLAVAVQQWKDLPSVPSINVEVRYDIDPVKPPNAHKVRKNIQGVETHYNPSIFPFCTPEELHKFNEVPVKVYADMLAPLGLSKDERHDHSDTYIRAMILLHWFDQVINSSMQRDLTEVSAEVRRTAQGLRRERLLMARKRVQQVHGRDFDMDSGMDSDTEEDLMKSSFNQLFITRPPIQGGHPQGGYPPPSRYEPFEEEKYDLQGDLDKVEARSESVRARTAQGLRSKLQQRRMRRGKASGHKALVDAVSQLQKLN